MKIERVFDLLPRYEELYGKERVLLTDKSTGEWRTFSIKMIKEGSDKVARALLKLGIKKGDKIGIIVENCGEWLMMDFGIQKIGAVSVPIYPTITIEDYAFIFDHAEVKLVFTGNEELYTKALHASKKCNPQPALVSLAKIPGSQTFSDFLATGETGEDLAPHSSTVKGEDLLTFIYTSGTTGFPKGVMLTHNNLKSNFVDVINVLCLTEKDRALSFLPLCHVFERMVMYYYVQQGIQVYFAQNMTTIGDNLKEVKPHFFTTAPRMLEKVFDKIVTKGFELSGIKRFLFFWALRLGEKFDFEKGNGFFYDLQLALARKLIFSKWKAALGGDIKFIVSGSAALQPRLARVFGAAGIPILEGYGLTETSPVVSVNNLQPENYKVGTVGVVIPNVEVKIASDGEILVKGPNVMAGYYKQEQLTKEVIKDGWFHTGDIGEMVDGKFLKITDRKKDMFKTSGGKYIAPQPIENKLKESIFIDAAMVIGDGKHFPSALLVPNEQAIKDYCQHKGYQFKDIKEALSKKEILDKFQREVDMANLDLAQWEKIKKFKVLERPLELEKGELTATLKVRRKVIYEHFAQEIEEIYR